MDQKKRLASRREDFSLEDLSEFIEIRDRAYDWNRRSDRTYYHVTTKSRLPSILSQGLRPRRQGGLTYEEVGSRRKGKIFLFASRMMAESIMEDRASTVPGQVLLRVEVPRGHRLYLDKETHWDSHFFEDIRVVNRGIPASNIKVIPSNIDYPKSR